MIEVDLLSRYESLAEEYREKDRKANAKGQAADGASPTPPVTMVAVPRLGEFPLEEHSVPVMVTGPADAPRTKAAMSLDCQVRMVVHGFALCPVVEAAARLGMEPAIMAAAEPSGPLRTITKGQMRQGATPRLCVGADELVEDMAQVAMSVGRWTCWLRAGPVPLRMRQVTGCRSSAP